MSGTGVPEGFAFPWNTARTMADVWADERETERAKLAKAAETARQLAFVAEYQSRKQRAATVTPTGRVAYAGYDGDDEMSLGGYESGLRASYAAVHQRLRNSAPLRIAAPPVKVEVAPVEVAEPPKPRARDMMMLASDPGPFRWKSIADQVCKKRGVPIEMIRGDGRAKPVCAARHELCYRLYTETGMSLPQVGRFLSKDHSTVLHSVRRYKAILEAGE